MTLEEFLKDKQLPVKVRAPTWPGESYFHAHYLHGNKFFGHSTDSTPTSFGIYTNDNWALYEEKPKKPRLLAWRESSPNILRFGVVLAYENCQPALDMTNWERCPWLDSPAEGNE